MKQIFQLFLICFLYIVPSFVRGFEATIPNSVPEKNLYAPKDFAHAKARIRALGQPMQGWVYFMQSSQGISFKCTAQGEVTFEGEECGDMQTDYEENRAEMSESNSELAQCYNKDCVKVSDLVMCGICGILCNSRTRINHYDRKHLTCIRKSCLGSNEVFATPSELEEHKKMKHLRIKKQSDKLLSCPICSKKFDAHHRVQHFEDQHLICTRKECGNLVLYSREQMKEHKKAVHNKH
jgi:hypothetical protein